MTNTVSYPTGIVANADGLQVKYGLAEARKAANGSPTSMSGNDDITLVFELDAARLPAFSANEGVGQLLDGYSNQYIPSGAFIRSVRLTPTTAWTGTNATLSIGLTDATGVTEIDNDGILDAVAIASFDTIGEAYTTGGALVGDNDTAVITSNGYFWVSVQTATFTAGHAKLEVTYYMPRTIT